MAAGECGQDGWVGGRHAEVIRMGGWVAGRGNQDVWVGGRQICLVLFSLVQCRRGYLQFFSPLPLYQFHLLIVECVR